MSKKITAMLVVYIIAGCSNTDTTSRNSSASQRAEITAKKVFLDEIPRIDSIIDTQADYISYDNYDALKAASDLVAIVMPQRDFQKNRSTTTYNTDGTIMDFSSSASVRILKVIKGDNIKPGDLIDLIEPVGVVYEDRLYKKLTTEGYSEMLKNRPYVVYLKKNSFGDLSVINMSNGKFDLNELKTDANKKISLKNGELSPREVIINDMINAKINTLY